MANGIMLFEDYNLCPSRSNSNLTISDSEGLKYSKGVKYFTQGCQNKPAPGAFDRLLVRLRRLLWC